MLYEKNHVHRSSVLWFHLYKLSTRYKVIDTENSLETTKDFAGKEAELLLDEYRISIGDNENFSEIIRW